MAELPAALYVAFDVFPRAKGSSTHIASMVQALARNYGRVRLLCLGTEEMPAFQQEGPIEIYRYRGRHRHLLRRATAFAGFVTGHTQQLAGQLTFAAFRDPWGGYPLLRANPRCPTLFEVNALPSWEIAYSRPGWEDDPALMAKLEDMERRCLRDCSRILCVSSVTRRALVRRGCDAGKIEVIPNTVDDVFSTPPSCAIPAIEEGDWAGYIGGLQPWQGVDSLLEAFALTSRGRLLILPGDSLRAKGYLENRITQLRLRDRVMIHSAITHAEVAGVMARLRFTVVPLADTPRNTVQGCCPIKLVESMGAGTPPVASDLAVVREWVTHDREGLLVEPGDRRGWALAMETLFRDEELRRRLGAAARLRAGQCFSWNGIHRQLDGLFDRTLGTNHEEEAAKTGRSDAGSAPGDRDPPDQWKLHSQAS